MGHLTNEEILDNTNLGRKYPDLRVPLYMELDTDGAVRVKRDSIRREDNGVSFTLEIEDGFDYKRYQEKLKNEGFPVQPNYKGGYNQ